MRLGLVSARAIVVVMVLRGEPPFIIIFLRVALLGNGQVNRLVDPVLQLPQIGPEVCVARLAGEMAHLAIDVALQPLEFRVLQAV